MLDRILPVIAFVVYLVALVVLIDSDASMIAGILGNISLFYLGYRVNRQDSNSVIND
jgi:hypothetical protein